MSKRTCVPKCWGAPHLWISNTKLPPCQARLSKRPYIHSPNPLLPLLPSPKHSNATPLIRAQFDNGNQNRGFDYVPGPRSNPDIRRFYSIRGNVLIKCSELTQLRDPERNLGNCIWNGIFECGRHCWVRSKSECDLPLGDAIIVWILLILVRCQLVNLNRG